MTVFEITMILVIIFLFFSLADVGMGVGKTQHFLCRETRGKRDSGSWTEGSSMASYDGTMANNNGRETVSLNGEPVVKRLRESTLLDSPLRVPKEPQNKVTVVLGAQWGDEGKGKVVDLLAMDADIVCRCQVARPKPLSLCLSLHSLYR